MSKRSETPDDWVAEQAQVLLQKRIKRHGYPFEENVAEELGMHIWQENMSMVESTAIFLSVMDAVLSFDNGAAEIVPYGVHPASPYAEEISSFALMSSKRTAEWFANWVSKKFGEDVKKEMLEDCDNENYLP